MLFAAVFSLGYYFWRKAQLRRLDIERLPASLRTAERLSKIQGFYIAEFQIDRLVGLEDVEIRSSDIWVCSLPKSGTTWTMELVWILANDCNFELAKSATLDARCPFLEDRVLIRPLADRPSPRVIMTHLPFALLPRDVREGKCKIVYVMRNPKDVTISLHHFLAGFRLAPTDESVLEVGQRMIEGRVMCGPYWTHMQQFWEQRGKPHVFINTFEQMKRDLPGTVRTLATFLGKKLTDEQVDQVAKWCSFSEMKNNPMANRSWNPDIQAVFMRKGIVGDWKNHLTPELSTQFDAIYDEHLKPLGIVFDSDHD